MRVLNVIRTPKNLQDKYSDSYLRAIKKMAEKEGIEVNVITELPTGIKDMERALNEFCIRNPNTLILEPCEFKFNRMYTLEKNLTAKAVFNLIEECNDVQEVETVAILNRSTLIGQPLHQMLLQANYTPIMLHSFTSQGCKEDLLGMADIIVSATGTDMTSDFDSIYHENFNIIDVSNDYRNKDVFKLADQSEIGRRTLDLLFKELKEI